MLCVSAGEVSSELVVEEGEAIPPRYWWLKRIIIASTSLIVALVLLRLWWGWYADRLLQAEIDRIVAASEPIYPEDFDPKESVPDEQNAARFLQAAEGKLSLTMEQSQLVLELSSSQDMAAKQINAVRGIIEANQEVLVLVRKARNSPHCDWGLRIRSPAINSGIGSYGGQRRLSEFLYVVARYRWDQKEQGEALETLQDILLQGQAIATQPSLLANVVGSGVDGLSLYELERTAPAVRIAENEVDGVGGAANREVVLRMIAFLVDEKPQHSAMRGAMRGKRMLIHDFFRCLIDGNRSPGSLPFGGMTGGAYWYARTLQWPITPLYTLNARWALKVATMFREAAEATTFVGVRGILPEIPEDNDRPLVDRLLQPMGWDTFASIHRSFVLHFRHLAMRRMAGIALAIRLFQIDHGLRPQSLGQLVPDYLDAVPADPFGDGARAIGYLPDAVPPILYSIGDDGVDDGGRFALRNNGDVNMNVLDIVYFLDGNRPMPKAAGTQPATTSQSETSEDGDNVEHQGGNSDETKPQQNQPE